MNPVSFSTERSVSENDFVGLLGRCSLGARRPVDDPDCIRGMLKNGDLTVSAWDGERLVGIARSVTDFHYACYLSDLAVDEDYQGRGIGLRLQQLTQEKLGPHCILHLISAPAANDYYPAIGYESCDRCWTLARDRQLGSS